MYPVDLPDVEDSELMSVSQHFLSSLEATPLSKEWFQSSQTLKVDITAANMRQLQLFEDDRPARSVLALHPPDDQAHVVALYLRERWWRVDDVLRTSSKSRSGLVSVKSTMERVIVFLLSQVVERPLQGEALFSLHPRTESCKVLWSDKQAVGFYTVKNKGSLCDAWSGCCYLLPVLDTALVRKSCRGRGFGLQILEDFCSSFCSEEFLGVSFPVSPSMAAAIRRFLQLREEQRGRLYEVEAPGGWAQRRNIWLGIQLGRYSLGVNEDSAPTSGRTRWNENSNLSQQGREPNLTSPSACNATTPLTKPSAEQQIPLNESLNSPSSEVPGSGPGHAAHTDYLDSRLPKRTQITKPARKSKAPHLTKRRGSRGKCKSV